MYFHKALLEHWTKPLFPHQRGQLGNEIQLFKDDVHSAIAAGRFELITLAHPSIHVMACVSDSRFPDPTGKSLFCLDHSTGRERVDAQAV